MCVEWCVNYRKCMLYLYLTLKRGFAEIVISFLNFEHKFYFYNLFSWFWSGNATNHTINEGDIYIYPPPNFITFFQDLSSKTPFQGARQAVINKYATKTTLIFLGMTWILRKKLWMELKTAGNIVMIISIVLGSLMWQMHIRIHNCMESVFWRMETHYSV